MSVSMNQGFPRPVPPLEPAPAGKPSRKPADRLYFAGRLRQIAASAIILTEAEKCDLHDAARVLERESV